jgi:hypothetical protein
MKDWLVRVENKDHISEASISPFEGETFFQVCLEGLERGRVFVNGLEITKGEYLIPGVGLQKTWHYKEGVVK